MKGLRHHALNAKKKPQIRVSLKTSANSDGTLDSCAHAPRNPNEYSKKLCNQDTPPKTRKHKKMSRDHDEPRVSVSCDGIGKQRRHPKLAH